MQEKDYCLGCPIITHIEALGVIGIVVRCKKTPDEEKKGGNGHNLVNVKATKGKHVYLDQHKITCQAL